MKSHNLALCSSFYNGHGGCNGEAGRSHSPSLSSSSSISLDQDLADLLAQLQDEFGQLSLWVILILFFKVIHCPLWGNLGRLAWVRLQQPQEQRCPFLSVCVVSVWIRIWQTCCRMSLGRWACEEFGSPCLGKATAATRAALPIPVSVCSVSLDQDLADLLQDEFGQVSLWGIWVALPG